jgi:Flp pilus assembly protein protease CpaA
MQEYYFLYAVALVWVIFATVQDLRKTEIANWLTFSLIAFVLAYRGFYAVWSKDIMFFVYGLVGVLVFVVLGYGLYYGRVFGGGDAKLLMGLGGIWPYSSGADYVFIGLGFVFLLFLAGAIYTMLFSFFLVGKNRDKFVKEFRREFGKMKRLYLFVLLLGALMFFIILISGFVSMWYFISLGMMFVLLPLLWVYTKAIESSCMLVLRSPGKLIEGDWLVKDVRVSGRVIKKTVHGLSKDDIRILRKAKKKVWIKKGVPFTPAFLIAFVIGIWIWLRYLS